MTEDRFKAYSKKLMVHQEQKNKAHQILAMLLARKMYEKSIKTLYDKHSSKTFLKLSWKSCLVILTEGIFLK